MSTKVHIVAGTNYSYVSFRCPGCKEDHAIRTDRWTFNGSNEKPTFRPSVLYEGPRKCHSYVTDGQIQFLNDSQHQLAGKTVDLPDWDPQDPPEEKKAMEQQKFERGDKVRILASHLAGIAGEVLGDEGEVDQHLYAVRISEHQFEGFVTAFSADQLTLLAPRDAEVSPTAAADQVQQDPNA